VQEGLLAIYESAWIYGSYPFAPGIGKGLTSDQFVRSVAFLWDRQPYYPHNTFYTHEPFMGSFEAVGGSKCYL